MAAHDLVTIWIKFVGAEWSADRRSRQETGELQMMESPQATWRLGSLTERRAAS